MAVLTFPFSSYCKMLMHLRIKSTGSKVDLSSVGVEEG